MTRLALFLTGCVPTYSVTNDTTARGGDAQPNITDAQTCLSRCAETDTCVGASVDFGFGVTLCWFHVDEDDFDDTFANQNAYLYRLINRCPQGKKKRRKNYEKPTFKYSREYLLVLGNSLESNWVGDVLGNGGSCQMDYTDYWYVIWIQGRAIWCIRLILRAIITRGFQSWRAWQWISAGC